MLLQLTVKNFVLIDQITIDFQKGLTVFTGETGAGKSLMVDAIALLSGQRASSQIIANERSSATVEGVFSFKKGSASATIAENYGFDSDDVMVFSREISKDNKNICKINQRIVPLSAFKEILESEIDIHSQHDTQFLLQEKNHIHLLDNFLQDNQLVEAVRESFLTYQKDQKHYRQLFEEQLDEVDREFLQYQLNEIEQLNPTEETYQNLLARQQQMMAYEKISLATGSSLSMIHDEQGVLEKLFTAIKTLSELKEDPTAAQFAQPLYDAYAIIEDIKDQLADHIYTLSFDQQEFEDVQSVLAEYDKMKRRHGPTIADVLKKRDMIAEKLYRFEHHEQVLADAKKAMDHSYDVFMQQAQNLSAARKKASVKLTQEIQKHLKDLQLPHAEFDVRFEVTNASKQGVDKVSFFLKTNPGTTMAPLVKVASGGELSRLMLGLKAIFTPLQGCGTIIFDEIDVGVSGAVARRVGLKMHELSLNVQTFAITHLPVVACFGETHFDIRKLSEPEKTIVNITLLNREQRIHQLAMMAYGNDQPTAISAAEALLIQIQEEVARG